MIKYVINSDNSYGGAFTSLEDGINFTDFEPKNPTDIWNGSTWVDNYPIEVPEEISKMALSLELFDRGITDQDIFDDIDSVPDSIFPLVEKERAKIKYITARSFVRSNMEVNLVATMEGLSQDDVDQIFINGKLR